MYNWLIGVIHADLPHYCTLCSFVSYMLSFPTNVNLLYWCHTCWPSPLMYILFIGVIHVDLPQLLHTLFVCVIHVDLPNSCTPCSLVSCMLTFHTNVHLVHLCHTCDLPHQCTPFLLVSYMLTLPTTVHLVHWCHTCWPSPTSVYLVHWCHTCWPPQILYTLFIGVIHVDLPH